jgi:hypothetical protein
VPETFVIWRGAHENPAAVLMVASFAELGSMQL